MIFSGFLVNFMNIFDLLLYFVVVFEKLRLEDMVF